MEAYIDDMLVKSKERFDHTKYLQEAFKLLRRYDMKLNPLKCAFEVSLSKFLGFMVTQRGIEANPIQLKAIMDSQAPMWDPFPARPDWRVRTGSGIPYYHSITQNHIFAEAISKLSKPINIYI